MKIWPLVGSSVPLVQPPVLTPLAPYEPCYFNVHQDVPCLEACLRGPSRVVPTLDDGLLIADTNVIQRVSHLSDPLQCRVTTLVGTYQPVVRLGPLATASFNYLLGIAPTRSGDLIAVDGNEGVVLLIRY